MADITFNGTSASSLGVKIVGAGPAGPAPSGFEMPVRDVTVETVPGYNGQYVIDNGRWLPVALTYQAAVKTGTMASVMDAVRAWLSVTGRKRLTDARFSGEYRMARVAEALNLQTYGRLHLSTFTLSFVADPERWLVSGDTEVTIPQIAAGGTLDYTTAQNPTGYPAYPSLDVSVLDTADEDDPITLSFYVGSAKVTVTGLVGAYESAGSTEVKETMHVDGGRMSCLLTRTLDVDVSTSGSCSGKLTIAGNATGRFHTLSAVREGGTDVRDKVSITFKPRWYRL